MSSETELADAADRRRPDADVAVIGIAIRVAEADDLDQFLDNLRTGRDSVRDLSAERRRRTGIPLDGDFQLNGYLEDIDSFDHEFFGISLGEARTMAPQHRLMLQVAYQAVEHAGYDPTTLRGRRVAVYLGDTRIEYQRLASAVDQTMVMGSHVSATAGRVARFLGLRGTAAMVDSACSSALLAVRHGVADLLLGDAELALVGGVNLNLVADRRHDELDIGIRSADGKTRCFAADADGTGSGEAVAAVLLKPLSRALADGDQVHAVIKGIAANQVGGRASTLTAPDAAAQAEVIEAAWQAAGIDPTTVTYIEAHGTGTRLGDPIEIEGINLAYRRHTTARQHCAVSSVKSNLGHTWSAAGIVGLVKAILAVRAGELFPNVHTTALNPYIDFADAAVRVTTELTPWRPECGVRRAGVSSFGVMGTNVHAVVEQPPPRPTPVDSGGSPASGWWLPVSARSAASLAANLAALRRWVEQHPQVRLADLQHTLVAGRAHYRHRWCVTVHDRAQLLDALAGAGSAGTGPGSAGSAGTGPGSTGSAGAGPVPEPVVVALVSGDTGAAVAPAAALCRDHPQAAARHDECMQAAGDLAGTDPVRWFARRYACHDLLTGLGLDIRHAVGEGDGSLVLAAAAGRLPLPDAVRQAGRDGGGDLDARIDRLLARLAGLGPLLFVEAGPASVVSRRLGERIGGAHRVVTLGPDGLPGLLRDLYLAGASWRWAVTAGPGQRVELPGYQFQRIRCWITDAGTGAPTPARTAMAATAPADPAAAPAVPRAAAAAAADRGAAAMTPAGAPVADVALAAAVPVEPVAVEALAAEGASAEAGAAPAGVSLGTNGAAAAAAAAAAAVGGVDTVDGVADVWRQVLGLGTLDVEASFFDLGGDSISSSYVVRRLEGMFGVDLDVLAIFDYDTPLALARHIDEVRAEQAAARTA